MGPEEWRQKYIQRLVEHGKLTQAHAEAEFVAAEFNADEMNTLDPVEMADEEMSGWDGDEDGLLEQDDAPDFGEL
jgi:hypothetical protein